MKHRRQPIRPDRLRTIQGSFSWIDHRILHHGYLRAMSPQEMLLYFFLVLVGDRNGISYYSYDRICQMLKMPVEGFLEARNALCRRGLIAVEDGRYQVLALPPRPPAGSLHPAAPATKRC